MYTGSWHRTVVWRPTTGLPWNMEHVHIMQGMSLYKEISLECIRCNMRRKKFLEVKMGGVKTEQLIVAPPFWACKVDLFRPYKTFVPGHEKQTRNKQMLECQMWILAVVCPKTRLVNLQVVEKIDAGGIICGITRLVCETGHVRGSGFGHHSCPD